MLESQVDIQQEQGQQQPDNTVVQQQEDSVAQPGNIVAQQESNVAQEEKSVFRNTENNAIPSDSNSDLQKSFEALNPPDLPGIPDKSITGETLPEIQGENGMTKSLQSAAVESQNKPGLIDLPAIHGDVAQQIMNEQEEAKKEDKMFAKISQSQEEAIKKYGTLLPLGDIARPDLYLQDQHNTPQIGGAEVEHFHHQMGNPAAQDEPHIERKQYDDDYTSSAESTPGGSFKKDQLPLASNTTAFAASDNKTTPSDKPKGEDKPKTDPANSNTTSPLDNNIVNNTAALPGDKPHGLNIEISKSKSVTFDNPSGVKLSTSTAPLNGNSTSESAFPTAQDNPIKRTHIPKGHRHKKAEIVISKLRKTSKGMHSNNENKKEELKSEKGDKKNAVIVNRPDVVYHPPPEIHHRPPIIVHRPPLVINRPPIIYHQPPVVVHRPPVMYQQPPLIFHQPPPAVSQPIMHSHDHFVHVPQLQHVGSSVVNHGSFFGVPSHSFGGGNLIGGGNVGVVGQGNVLGEGNLLGGEGNLLAQGNLVGHVPFQQEFGLGQDLVGDQQTLNGGVGGISYLNGHDAEGISEGTLAGRSVQILNLQPQAEEMVLGARKSTMYEHHKKVKKHHIHESTKRSRRDIDAERKGITKKDVVVNRPPIIYHPPPEVYHRPDIVIHRPPIVVHRPPIIYHQPPVIVHRPAVVYHPPPIVFHQPPPAVSQPLLYSHDTFNVHPSFVAEHVSSVVSKASNYVGPPRLLTQLSLLGSPIEPSTSHDDAFDDLPTFTDTRPSTLDQPTVEQTRSSLPDENNSDDDFDGLVKRNKIARHKTTHDVTATKRGFYGGHHGNIEFHNLHNGAHEIVVHRPGVVFHPPPEVIHRPNIVIHRAPLLIQRPSIVVHQPPVVIHRPPVYVHQPDVVFKTPAPIVHQPHFHSHDIYAHRPHLHHVHSDLDYSDHDDYNNQHHYGPAVMGNLGHAGDLGGLSEEGLGEHGYAGSYGGIGEGHGFSGNVLDHGIGFDDSALGFHHSFGGAFHHHPGHLEHGMYDNYNGEGIFDTQHEDYGNHEPYMRGSSYFDEGLGDVYGVKKYGKMPGLDHVGVGMSRSKILEAARRRAIAERDDKDNDDSDDEDDDSDDKTTTEQRRRSFVDGNAYARSVIIPQPSKTSKFFLKGNF